MILDIFNEYVVYKTRNSNKRWKGPGEVFGHDGEHILVKHGTVCARTLTSHATLSRNAANLGHISKQALLKQKANQTKTLQAVILLKVVIRIAVN